MMGGLLTLVIIFLIIKYIKGKKSVSQTEKKISVDSVKAVDPFEELKETLPIAGAYQKKWLLTYNEKDAYKSLKTICDENGLYLMTKVRLFDLVEPIKGNPKYMTYRAKIQSKHIDFVICDARLVARCLVELDDNSHNTTDRVARDTFVDEVVRSVGYKMIRTRGITEAVKAEVLESVQ